LVSHLKGRTQIEKKELRRIFDLKETNNDLEKLENSFIIVTLIFIAMIKRMMRWDMQHAMGDVMYKKFGREASW
jgi:hypothetical protein